MTGYFVFCIGDLLPVERYVPATHTVFPEAADADAYADTIAVNRDPIVISRDVLFELLQNEQRDFHKRWKTTESPLGRRKLHVAGSIHATVCRITPPSGDPFDATWVEFRKSVSPFVNDRTLLDASAKILRDGSVDIETAIGVYRVVVRPDDKV